MMLKQFSAIIFSLAFIVLSFNSCQKHQEDPVESNLISVDIDGVKTYFNAMDEVSLNILDLHRLDVQGFEKASPDFSNNLSFTVIDTVDITTKTYSESIFNYPHVDIHYTSALASNVRATANSRVSNPVSVTITDITPTTIKGTFSGELWYYDLNNNDVKTTLSNGVFRLND